MKLKEILELKYGKSQKKITSTNGRYPIIGTGGILGYSNVFLYNKPSVIIGRKGSINNKMYIDFPFWVVDTTFYTIIDTKKVIPRWFYYYISTIDLNKYNEGTTIPSLTIKTLYELDIPYFPLEEQQHIVDIIGSIDDKIENNNKIIKKLEEFGIKNYFKLSNKLEDILLYSKFERGKEASSKNYSEIKQKNFINFIRVKDLNVLTNTYISNSLKLPLVEKKDTIIALDGTVGRTNFGLSGAYSSGLYKVVPVNEKYRGIIYFSLKDNFNQNIIQYYATGTTILHAGKSINHLKIKKHKENDLILFNKLYEFMLFLKQENIKLNNLKQLYLKKFFG